MTLSGMQQQVADGLERREFRDELHFDFWPWTKCEGYSRAFRRLTKSLGQLIDEPFRWERSSQWTLSIYFEEKIDDE